MKNLLGLLVGLVVGIVGAILFQQSLPPDEGSTAEALEIARHELKEANQKVAALEAETGTRPGGKSTFKDRARTIAEDIRAGRDVDIDDVFATFKPVMRDLAPLFDRIRLREERQKLDAMANELVRKYGLGPSQKQALDQWIETRAQLNAEAFNAVFASETTTYRDMVRAAQDQRQDEGLDQFMEGVLQGENLEQFRADRMNERVERVQQEADRNTTRLDNIVGLDERQKDEVFLLMARGSRDFDPGMQFEGLGGASSQLPPGAGRNEAIESVLRLDQRERFDNYQAERRAEAEEDLRAVGLSLPDDWDLYDDIGF